MSANVVSFVQRGGGDLLRGGGRREPDAGGDAVGTGRQRVAARYTRRSPASRRRCRFGMLHEFQAAWPCVHVELTEAEDDAQLLHLVERCELDLSFVVLPMMPGPFEHQELLEDPYVLVVRGNSPLGASVSIHPRDLAGILLVTCADA